MQHAALVRRLSLGPLWNAYERQLSRQPLLTQATTSALLWGAGDLIAQRIERKPRIDWNRAIATGAFGGSLVGPVGHYWYLGLDKACSRWFRPGSAQFIASKVALDSAILGPFYVFAFFAFGNAVIDRAGWGEFKQKMDRDFLPTLMAELSFWPAVQGINFWRVPIRHQLLVVNAMTVFDAAFMSWARSQEDWFGNLMETLSKHQKQSASDRRQQFVE